MGGMSKNHLQDSTSPYLQQHADNPVHWHEWGEPALRLAREQNKPILLSIGYSACHWCHVMAHESFEDPATAAVMNELFVNIKVDREERPDLDKIYQTAHQLLSRRPGGWPLTVFLTPDDQAAFFAGTYFPPEPRHGRPSFIDLMQQVHAAWQEQPEAIREQNRSLQLALAQLTPPAASAGMDTSLVDAAVRQLSEHFDPQHGGIGSAPKFPHPNTLEFLLYHAQLDGDEHARHMALFTLQKMATGGMNDQLGGGFCRYSVDDQWMIPHFEKMLYDNGPLLGLYADAWQLDEHRPLFKHVCERTAEWVMREMQAPAGGYYSSLDADSEGEEGRFYVWDREQVAELLSEPEYDLFAQRFGLDRPANFEGRWNPHIFVETPALAEHSGLSSREVRRHLKSARDKLFDAREQRVRPGRDEKILTSWNALMIKGMARSGRLLQHPEWVASAERALAFLRENHWRENRLLATSRDGEARLSAYLDDYAFLLDALLEMLQTRWQNDDLTFAVELAEALLAHFDDRENGGFWFTADDHEQLLTRMKPFSDEAIPAGNAIAARALHRLGMLLGETRYLEAAERTLAAAAAAVTNMPYAHPGLLIALLEANQPLHTLVIRAADDDLSAWHAAAHRNYQPERQIFAIPNDIKDLPNALKDKSPKHFPCAYLCRGMQCEPPVLAVDSL